MSPPYLVTKKNLNVQIEAELLADFSAKCIEQRMSKSEVVRALIEAYIDNQLEVVSERSVQIQSD